MEALVESNNICWLMRPARKPFLAIVQRRAEESNLMPVKAPTR